MQHKNGKTSYHTITKNSPFVTDEDNDKVEKWVSADYGESITGAEPIMTIDQLSGDRVLIAGADSEWL